MNQQGTARVFVTQENQGIDYTPAEKFGEVVFLTRHEPSQMANSLRNADIKRELETKLRDFDPYSDFVCPSGSPAVVGLAFFILSRLPQFMSRQHQPLRILRWSNRDKTYGPINLTV